MKISRTHAIEVPEDEQAVLVSLLALTAATLAGLESALNRAKPTLETKSLVGELQNDPLIAEVPDLEQIVESLMKLAGTAYSESLSASLVIEAVIEAIRDGDVAELSDTDGDRLSALLQRLSQTTSLEIVTKAGMLLREGDRSFRSVRVVSALRPICAGEDLSVSAGVIVHQLAIRALRNGRRETTYFDLDSDDLASVIDVVSRALRKDKALRAFAARSETPILLPVPE